MSSYDEKLSQYYDAIYSSKDYQSECQAIKSFCNKKGFLLDIGCGTLNHSIILSSDFDRIIAVDLSKPMIDVANKKLERLNVKNVEALNVNLYDLEYEEKFDVAISMFNVVNHVESIFELSKFFRSIAKKMKLRGRFIFDCWNGIACIRNIPKEMMSRQVFFNELTIDLTTKTSTDLMRSKSLMSTDITISRGNEVCDLFSYELNQKLWTPDNIRDLLQEAGFEVVKMIPFFKVEEEVSIDDYRITWMCEKIQ